MTQGSLPCIVTATTESARSLYTNISGLHIRIGKLDSQSLPKFLREQQIAAILDASHPFAVEVSELAIEAANEFQIPYLRYERPLAETVSPDGEVQFAPKYFDSFESLLADHLLLKQRVLLTVGYRSLHQFQAWQERTTLFARILPSEMALKAALGAGFTSDRLIAIRPPVSAQLERALWQQWQISMVVTKASGTSGGEDVKRQVAEELGVQLIVVDRPAIHYPRQTSELTAAIEFCQQL
jgi:precorrin-6A/cobalt-precorrin-6A reductase